MAHTFARQQAAQLSAMSLARLQELMRTLPGLFRQQLAAQAGGLGSQFARQNRATLGNLASRGLLSSGIGSLIQQQGRVAQTQGIANLALQNRLGLESAIGGAFQPAIASTGLLEQIQAGMAARDTSGLKGGGIGQALGSLAGTGLGIGLASLIPGVGPLALLMGGQLGAGIGGQAGGGLGALFGP